MAEFSLFPAILPPGAGPALIAASFLTSAMTAAFGIGGGVMLLAGMSYVMPVAALIPVHGAVQFGSNFGRMVVQRRYISWDKATPFVAGSIVGAVPGAMVVTRLDEAPMTLALGMFVLIITWIKIPALARAGPRTFAAGGAATAFATMFFGATGPLVAVFFAHAFDDRRRYAGSHAAVMAVQHALKVAAFAFAGFAFLAWLPLMAAMIASGYAGTIAGSNLLGRLPEARFRWIFRWLVTAIALDMMRRGLSAAIAP